MRLAAFLTLGAVAGSAAAPARPHRKGPPKKLAVLGTGVGNMAAVFYLTNYTGWEEDWDIDVYQYGWRMGGKAASARTMSDVKGSRILEHGLHLFFGWYSNAFMWVQDLYRAWQPPADSPIQTWQDGFKPSGGSGFYVHRKGKTPEYRPIVNLPMVGVGGSGELPDYPLPAPTPWQLFVGLVQHLARLFPDEQGAYAGAVRAAVASAQPAGAGPPAAGSPRRAALLSRLRAVQSLVESDLAAVEQGGLSAAQLAGRVGRTAYEQAGHDMEALPYKPTPEDYTILAARMAKVMAAASVGMVADNVTGKGFHQLNDENIVDWLARHGCKLAFEDDDVLRAWQDLLFGYVGGMHSKPNMAAGTALRSLVAFTGAGTPGVGQAAMRFQAGMGEVLMSPSYQVLKQRGVRFHFFHKVTDLRTSDGTTVDAIDINVQATVKAGSAGYEPLFPVKGLPVWPDLSTPKDCDGCNRFFDQLAEADAVKAGNVNLESWYSGWVGVENKTLRLGEDFDMVLNGITNGALPHVSKDLAAKNEAWRNWTSTTKTVSTQVLQMWVYNTTHELGAGPVVTPGNLSKQEFTVCGGPDPFDTWADFTHLNKMETDNAAANGGVPAGCHHFLSPVPFDGDGDVDFANASVPAAMFDIAYANSVRYVENDVRNLMPKWDYSAMVAPVGVVGQERLRHQYWRHNYEPGELYVLSVAGSIKYRPTPFKFHDAQGVQPFANMALAGDHVRNGLDDGCAESAATGGLMAAYGLTQGRSPSNFTDYERA